jgi:hypothetical protein
MKLSYVFVFQVAASFAFTSCTTDKAVVPKETNEPVAAETPKYEESRVIERIGGLKETPKWALGMEPMLEEKGNVIYVQTMTMDGNSRPEACTKAAGDTGRAEFVRQIRDGITAAGQVTEGSATSDVAIESSVAYLSNLKLSGVKITERYWEKAEESDGGGSRILKVRCAAKVAIPKTLLDQQIRKATETNAGNPEIRKRLLEGQKAFLDQLAKEAETPSTGESAQ